MSRRFLCIHAHFYQPARENPWLERIEIQDTAAPDHDWNERITRESYAPNAASRILDEHGLIEEIVNNYERISFNFGPTLLSWLEQQDRETYRKILEADAASRRRFGGHGNALAQPYNHMILPLATEEDARTQIRWGIADFRARFQREPEGMWLPEAAVDTRTLEQLAQEGIAFTVLSPYQAARMRRIGVTTWSDASGGRVDPSRPYLVKLPSGRAISVFFYDGPISRAVAFERLLARGADFLSRILEGFDPAREGAQLTHIATDGETYGHHHSHGDMALSWMLREIERRSDVELTNYALFLEQHPPEWEAEIVDESSWSCSHGIGRWRENCGCQTGGHSGWTQHWRQPLRQGLDELRRELRALYKSSAPELFRDPELARDEYVQVLLDRSDRNIDSWLDRHLSIARTQPVETNALRLLEMERNAQLMFTSCGWFFSDIGGIETVQVMQYAARAIQLAQKMTDVDLETPFLEHLARAKGNTPAVPDGSVAWKKFVVPARVDLARVAAQAGVRSIWEHMEPHTRIAAYEVTRERVTGIEAGRYRAAVGLVEVRSTLTRENERFAFAFLDPGDSLFIQGGVTGAGDRAIDVDVLSSALRDVLSDGDVLRATRLLEKTFPDSTDAMRLLFRDEQRLLVERIRAAAMEEAEAIYRQLYDRYVPLVRLHARLDIPLPRTLWAATELVLNLSLRRELEAPLPSSEAVASIVRQATKAGVAFDRPMLGFLYEKRVDEAAAELRRSNDYRSIEKLLSILEIADVLPFQVDLWTAQNSYEQLRREVIPGLERRSRELDPEAAGRLRSLREIGRRLRFREE